LQDYTTKAFIEVCLSENLAVAPVYSVKEVAELDFVKKQMIKTQLPDGKDVALSPAPMATDFLAQSDNRLSCAPRLGQHNDAILQETGLSEDEIQGLKEQGII
jgi:crotonobetainyl-CoA:carnitine CoA-transferase CaiB-like acyl-CoA transferase